MSFDPAAAKGTSGPAPSEMGRGGTPAAGAGAPSGGASAAGPAAWPSGAPRGSPGLPPPELDEGMWTLDNPPAERLKEAYGFSPSERFLEHLRLASLRFNDGGSGSFVSPEGLVLTNHHVALGQLQKMSGPRKDYAREGFIARSRRAEIRAPDLEVNQLVSLEDVTGRVLAAIPAGATDKEANERRKAAMASIEKESTDATGLRSDVVELYQGGEYWLYRYKKYTDVRLVMAPELAAAFFGGDHDNFTYPRFSLDFAFFRVYEDGRPVRPRRWFAFSRGGAREGELTFVTGHPGSTDRLLTMAQLRVERDIEVPTRLAMTRARLERVRSYAQGGPEQARRAQDVVLMLENSLKVGENEHAALLDPALFARKEAEEAALRTRLAADAALARECGPAWQRLEAAQKAYAERYRPYVFRRLRGRRLPWFAETILRWVVETAKPNEKRYEEFRDSALESLKFQLFSPAPVYPDLEEALLALGLEESLRELGPSDPFVREALGGLTPAEAARRAVSGTRLADPAVRRGLIEGGRAAVEASDDPMIALARRVDAAYREERAWYEDTIEAVERAEGHRIARARFALYGKSSYPDATFTLRLSYGQPLGYPLAGTRVPYKTTFGGLFDRADSFDGRPPFNLGVRVARARRRVRLATPLNFVTTHDIIGGNSGSPVVNRKAELVGLIFDGNFQSLAGRYQYSRRSARAVSVHSSAILESLRSVYGLASLVRELTRARR